MKRRVNLPRRKNNQGKIKKQNSPTNPMTNKKRQSFVAKIKAAVTKILIRFLTLWSRR